MANPQAENGHTDIANEILDYLVTFRMSGQEWQVLMFVVRKTYGWHKKQDSISYGQISEFTHIPRRTVIRIIKKLVAKKTLVASGQKDTSHPNIFEFNKNYEEWTSGQKDTGGQKATRVVAKKTPELVAKKPPTKEKKENKQKKTTASFVLPPDIDPKTWDAFCEMRTKLKAPLTDHAKNLILSKLETIGQDKNKVLNQSIERGWRGVFALKEDETGSSPVQRYVPTKEEEASWRM